jgi:hypothetical protein
MIEKTNNSLLEKTILVISINSSAQKAGLSLFDSSGKNNLQLRVL